MSCANFFLKLKSGVDPDFSVNGVQMIIGSKPWQLGNQCHQEDVESDEDEVGPSMDPRAKKRSRHINETNNEIFSTIEYSHLSSIIR